MDKLDKFIQNVGNNNNLQNNPTYHTFNSKQNKKGNPHKRTSSPNSKNQLLRVYPLGGLEEVGKNLTVFETKEDILIVDLGLQFPEENMYGVDYVVPDVAYLEKRRKKIRGVIITHGHLDHIGGAPHILPKLGFPPIYATALTGALINKRLEEFKLNSKVKIHTISAHDKINLGQTLNAEFFHINHSIPDGVGFLLNTPAGSIVHTGDFKFDFTPADDKPADFSHIAEIGNRNVLALFADSTNATEPGYTVSERVVGAELDRVIEKAKGRVIIATFSSLISRINQIIESSNRHGRKIFLSGRSIENNVEIASRLGYISAPRGSVRKLSQLRSLPDRKVTIITTGSQGEEMSALARISLGTHPKIKIRPNDTIVLSSGPIIGNEKAIATVINNLIRLGAHVVTNKHLDVHTSGHAKQEDLKLMLSLVKPKFLVPVHGDLRMRAAHRDLATSLGMPENHISLIDNGDIIEFANGRMRKSKSKVEANNIMIDGRSMGDNASLVQRERQIMTESGMAIIIFRVYETGNLVADPHIISRGFLYPTEERKILEEVIQTSKKAYLSELERQKDFTDKSRRIIRDSVAHAARKVIRKRLDREPLILPIMIRV